MNNIIIINKNEIDEIRVAFLKNNILSNLEVESENTKCQKGNIFKGFITKIESSLDAFFIDYGSNKDGFLSFKEISKDYLDKINMFDGLDENKNYNYLLGMSFIIQIDKEASYGKGASLTTYISLAGCYIVLMPSSYKLKGISKKINNKTRFILKSLLNNIDIINECGIIIRTFGYSKDILIFKIELLTLLSQLKFIKNLDNNIFLNNFIYEHNNLIIKILKDYLKFNINQIIINDIQIFNNIYKYLSILNSEFINNLYYYSNIEPIFNKFNIEKQIELLFKRELFLPSGGSITIDPTEALTFIDINSSKSNKCDDVEETALQTNLEAINEITKQLKIRDLNGLIIIDFIDVNIDNFKLLEKKFKEKIISDKAKIQLEKISKFGLLELSREKIKAVFYDTNFILCNKCQGTGKISNIATLASNIIKSIYSELKNKNIIQLNLELPVKIANYINNLKFNEIIKIEKIYKINILLLANEYLNIPDYKIYIYIKKYIKNKI